MTKRVGAISNRAVYLWTVQHTGTWLLIDLLTQHERFASFVQCRNLFGFLRSGGSATHALSGSRRITECINEQGGWTLMHSHVAATPDVEPDAGQLAMAYSLPTIVPLRDPLRSLVTKRQREPEDVRSVFDAWVALARAADVLGDRFLAVPVDLLTSREVAARVLDYLELPWTTAVERFVCAWPVVNSAGDYREKMLYQEGGFRRLEKLLGEDWGALCEREMELRPMLERCGYCDLAWWS